MYSPRLFGKILQSGKPREKSPLFFVIGTAESVTILYWVVKEIFLNLNQPYAEQYFGIEGTYKS